MKYNEVVLLVEKVSKEQQEIAQRLMTKRDLDPFLKLKKYLINKWRNTGIEGLKNKKIELERYKELLRASVKESRLTSPEIKEFIKQEMGFYPKFEAREYTEDDKCAFAYGDKKYILVNKDNVNKTTNSAGLFFQDDKEIRNIISKFILGHEYGHLFDFMKRYVETGKKYIIPTKVDTPKEAKATEESEGSASGFSIEGLYRKDRWELLKRALEIIDPEISDEENIKKLKKFEMKESEIKKDTIPVLKAYIKGLNNSELYKRIKKDIVKTNALEQKKMMQMLTRLDLFKNLGGKLGIRS